MNSLQTSQEFHAARVEQVTPSRKFWVLPVLALAFALYLGLEAWSSAGPTIRINAHEGHGVGLGDPLRFRGVDVGVVRAVELTEDLHRVSLKVRLQPEAAGLCREGSRFWIVRPRMGVDSVQGLETLVGARYLTVDPGDLNGAARYEFDALDDPPVTEIIEEAGLVLRFESRKPAKLSQGAQLTHRGVVVGVVLRTGLSSDGCRVEVEAYVRPAFVDLVRSNTRFWSTGGLEVSMALAKGLSIELDSLRSLVVGGIAFATPTNAGSTVVDGTLFNLEGTAPEAHDTWQPMLSVGGLGQFDRVAPGQPLACKLSWKSGMLIHQERTTTGWVVQTPSGILGPRELLALPSGNTSKSEESATLVIDGTECSLSAAILWENGDLVLREATLDKASILEAAHVRCAAEAQDALVFGPTDEAPVALSRSRYRLEAGTWRMDEDFELDPAWHGALAYGVEAQAYVGILLVTDAGCRVALFPPEAW